MCAVLLSSASPASAQEGSLSVSISPQFASPVTVGAQGVPAALLISNNSTGDFADDVLRIDEITLTPSCGARLGMGAFGTCPMGGEDPGVFVLNGPGVGRAGTGCAGRSFTITPLDAASGRYVFTPVGGELTLGAAGTVAGTCTIDFTFDVARAPAKDADPAQILPGPLQTDQYATLDVTVTSPGSTQGRTGRTFGSTETTVLPATPQIATQVSDASIPVGSTFTDTATVTGPAGAPVPTGTVSFVVHGPDDATCTGPPISFSNARPLNAQGVAVSGPFGPTIPGTYRVIALYTGDANYHEARTACNDPNETVVITHAPLITTQASAAMVLGQGTLTDTATVTGLINPVTGAGAGTVTFRLYGPNDPTCASPILTRSDRPLALNAAGTAGTADSGAGFTPTEEGTYRWIASYSGDVNNVPAAGDCEDTREHTGVRAALPRLVVTKTAAPLVRLVPGGNFTFTVVVTNESTTSGVTITSLSDDRFGNLSAQTGGPDPCAVLIGVFLIPGASETCTFVAPVTSAVPMTHTNVVTVTGTDPFGSVVTDSDDAVVRLVAVPQIAVTKDASPASRPVPGGNFTYTIVVSNPSTTTPVTITTLTDDVFGNLGTRAGDNTCDDVIGDVLAPGASATCTFVAPVTSAAPITHTNVVTVLGTDEFGNTVTDDDAATVTLTPVVNPPPPPPPPPPPVCVETGAAQQSNTGTVQQGANTATGGSATATGGAGGDASSANTVNHTGSGDSSVTSGDATGGNGGDATATGGDATATNTATQTQSNNVCAGAAGALGAAFAIPAAATSRAASEAASRRGTAAISGRGGCQARPFNVVVSGRQVARVVFALDGRVRRSLRRPNSAARYKLLVNPMALRKGRHRVLARVSFRSQSATPPKTLRVAFRRCSGGASQATAAG